LQHVPTAHFLVVGGALFGLEPEYPEELERLASDLGVLQRVHFLGHRDDVKEILTAVDLVVVPSRSPEPFGTIQIEAMAAGKALVSTAAGGNLEVVLQGETGVLVPPASPDDLAAAISRLLKDPVTRAQMGAAGRDRASQCFTAELMRDELLLSLRSVV
jgi:glycosyltransferase involved in cell wall biosynthesis